MSRSTNYRNPVLDLLPDYVGGRSIEEVMRERGVSRVVKLASNENPLGPSPEAIRALHEYAHGAHIYPDNYCVDLAAKVAEKSRVRPEQVIFSTGSDNVMQLAIWAFGKPGTYALAPSPGFLGYEIFARSFGLEILPMPLPNGLWDLDRWRNEARREDVSLVILTTPNNPTGTAFTHDELVDFLEFVPKHVTVILDMAYVEFDPNSPPDTEMLLELHENVICCRTFSKAYGLAGLRLGYGIAAEHHINDMKKLRTPYAANGASLAAALAAMNDEVHLHRSIDLARDGVEWWTENLTKLGVEVLPSSANFVMARVPEAPQIFDLMLDEGVIVRHLRAFRLEDGLRITCGLTEENEIALDAFKKALNTLRGVGQGL